VTALRAFVSALLAVQPLSIQRQAWAIFDIHYPVLRDRMRPEERAGAEAVAQSLGVRRQFVAQP
jgi:hypothetical protein